MTVLIKVTNFQYVDVPSSSFNAGNKLSLKLNYMALS